METNTKDSKILEQVREYYGKTLHGSDDLKTNATCCNDAIPPHYVLDAFKLIAPEVMDRFYGCGSPIPPALNGCTVLDLGCGTGRDVYALSKLVGEDGKVIGVDMTKEQLDFAREYQQHQAQVFGYEKSNVDFRCGFIEDLAGCGIEDESIDLVVSNCVINLSPFKDQIFSEIYRVLKPGGELYFSDVFCDRRIPDELRQDPVLRGECLGGAMYVKDFEDTMAHHGWNAFVYTAIDDIHVSDLALETMVGFASFNSRTVRAIKASGLERGEENCGQYAKYLGGIPEMPRYFDFTDEIRFIKGREYAISSNAACMLEQSRYGKYFEISAKGKHRGKYSYKQAQDALELRHGKKKLNLAYLEDVCKRNEIPSFEQRVNMPEMLMAEEAPGTMQVNITYACNLACRHCYLECSPKNTEAMSQEVMQQCLDAFEAGGFEVMDITGGSPEMHEQFERFLREASKLASTVIVRSNLTLLGLPEYEHFIDLFAELGVQVCASLPYFDSHGTDNQRGRGVFEKAIASIRKLNALGYGSDPNLELNLVYNVAGPFLPPPQELLADAYRKKLMEDQQIVFNELFAFNNFALGRFAQDLADSGLFDEYMTLLYENFNALAVGKMMCHDQVNVDVDGRLYDCECNHVLKMPIQLDGRDAHVSDLVDGMMPARAIRTHPVCYSCSAGAGSSCGGALI